VVQLAFKVAEAAGVGASTLLTKLLVSACAKQQKVNGTTSV